MTPKGKHLNSLPSALSAAALLVIGLGIMVSATVVRSQNPPGLQITSPSDNTIVNPGQIVAITVTSPNNTATQVGVIAEMPIGATALANALPAQLSLTIPQNIALGKYGVTAMGTTSAGGTLFSASINIDVERSDLPSSLTADRATVVFASQRNQEPLRFHATFADGAYLDVTRSSNIGFVSSNPSVASVDSNGTVTPVAKGTASITATYTVGKQSTKATVAVTVPPPVTTSTPATLVFNSQSVGTSSTPQTVTITNVSSNQGLTVGPVSVTGDFSETDNCASSSPIATGGWCAINVTFTPTAVGSRNGGVSVPDSMNIVPLTVSVTGTGIAPPSMDGAKNQASGSAYAIMQMVAFRAAN